MRDTEAVASIVAGDPDGLATAYDRYADPLFTYCRSLLGDAAAAADAVQDTFVIAAARLDGLHDPQRLRAWLFAVARGECLRAPRSTTRTQPPPEAPAAGGMDHAGQTDHPGKPDHEGRPDHGESTGSGGDAGAVGAGSDEAGRAGLCALFESACAGLGPGEREVIELQLRQGLEPDEAATVLGVSRGRAHALLSRARDQLENCLGVLLVSRAGRDECAELGSMLTGWDGRLTPTLRKRVGRHIEHCSACSARRAVELRPSAMLELAPAAALAAGAAESFRRAPGAPEALKAHTIALATEGGSASAAHATAVLSRAGNFGKQGFPKQAHGVLGTGGAGPRHAARTSPRSQAAVAAAVILAVGAGGAGFALTNGQDHRTPLADPKNPMSSAVPGATTSAGPARTATAPASPAARRSRAATPTAVTVVTNPAPTAAPSTTAKSPWPTASPSSSPSQPGGTLRVFPGGGSLFLVPGGRGALLLLSASGGTVNWSVSVSGDPGHAITVSPAASGTLTAANPHVALEITASQKLSCGNRGNPCPTITIEPGGTVLTVTTPGRRHPFRQRRRHDRHDGTMAATVF